VGQWSSVEGDGLRSCTAEVADSHALLPKMKLPNEYYSQNMNEEVRLCQDKEDWCKQQNGKAFVSFIKAILEKLKNGALIESLKRKLISHSEAKLQMSKQTKFLISTPMD